MSALYEIIGTGDGELKPSKVEKILTHSMIKDIVWEIVDQAMDIVDNDKVLKDKSPTKLIGTGDQHDGTVEVQESIIHHPPVEKKNRLTDLVKNSKQILQRIMMSDSKLSIHEQQEPVEENVLKVIQLDCALSKTTNDPAATPPEDPAECEKNMTFPRTTGARAKAAFTAKCRTLKREVTMKKKKWNVGGRLVRLFRKKRNDGDGSNEDCSSKKSKTNEG